LGVLSVCQGDFYGELHQIWTCYCL